MNFKKSKSLSKDLTKQANLLKHESLHDHLTGAGNRRQLDKYLEDNWQQNTNQSEASYLAMLDVDDFKNINDDFSHTLGDEVLQKISGIISENIRQQDRLFRYGGEEFTILINNASTNEAHKILNCCRMGIETHSWDKLDQSLKVTATIGMVSNHEQKSVKSALKLADERMYSGKKNGKNVLVNE